jgi:hypothetical protein
VTSPTTTTVEVLQKARALSVKPLEFPPTCPRGQRVHSRPQALIRYTIAHYAGDDDNAVYRWASESGSWSEPHNSYEAAKGCAQADYEDRILAVVDASALIAERDALREHIAKIHNRVRHDLYSEIEAAMDKAFGAMSGIGALRDARAIDLAKREAV